MSDESAVRANAVRGRDGRIRSSGLVERAHASGLAVHPYTFRRDELPQGFGSFPALLRFATRELAVDGLFTDFPDDVVRFLRHSG